MPDAGPSTLKRERAHSTLLLQRLLALRAGVSPFTLLLDSLAQASGPLVAEFVRRAKVGWCSFVSIAGLDVVVVVDLVVDVDLIVDVVLRSSISPFSNSPSTLLVRE